MKPGDAPWTQGSCNRDARGLALAVRAFALAPALVVALAAPVAGQQPSTVVAGPGSHEAVKKRALWTNCQGVTLRTVVDSDTDVAEESVWNAAEVALRSARIYFEDPETPEARSLWTVRVVVWGVGPANYVETALLEHVSDERDDYGPPDRGTGIHTVMTYRIETITANSNAATLLATVREQMDAFLVDYLRAHADCAEGSL